MSDYIRIEAASNGWVLTYDDPAIRAENRKNARNNKPYVDPERRAVFEGEETLLAALTTLLPTMKPATEDTASEFESGISDAIQQTE